MAGRGALYNIEIRKAISVPVVVYGCNATYTVNDAFSTTGAVSITAGTFDLLANPLTCASLSTWYTPYSAFMPALSPDPSPITVNLNANTVTVSGDISNDWQNYPNTPQSIATVNATNATISAANIVFRYATFNTGTSNISLTGNIELSYPAATNSTTFTGSSNITFGAASSAFNSYTGTNITCNSITTASNFTLYSVGSSTFSMNTLTLGGNLTFARVNVASNIVINTTRSTLTASLNTNSLTVGGKIVTLQDRAALLTTSSISYKLAFTYSGSAPALETNNFLYFFNVNVASGVVIAPAVADLGFNTGITFTGTARRIGFSAYSGAVTLPTDITPGAVMFAWGGGGGAGKRATSTSVASTTGGGSGAMSINVNVPIASGATVYVNAAVATSKQTANANGATGGSSWVNLVSNTAPVNNTQGILAVGGGGSSISSGAGGSGGLSISCIGDQAIGGLSGGGFYANFSSRAYLGGTGGASFLFAGGSQTVNTDTTASNNNRGGTGGGGVSGAGVNFTALSPNGTAGGLNQSSVAAAGGTGGDPPTAGASGTLGGGGAGGGGQVVTTSLSGSFTRIASSTATITYPNHGFKANDVVYLTLAYVTGTYTVSGLISGATWVRTAGSTTVNITTPSAHGLTTGNRRFFAFSGTNAPSTGVITLTVTGTTTLQITSSTPNTLAGSGTVNIGGLMTVTTTTPHGLIVGDTPYQTANAIGNSGPPVETVIDANNFTVARVIFSGTGGSTTLGSGLTTTADWSRTITAVTTNTFSFLTSSATYIYALATCTYRNPNGLGGNGGDGVAFANHYSLDYYNNVLYPSKYPIGLGGGGGGAGGVYTSSPYIYTGTGGSGGDGGIAAGGGGMGYGQQAGAASSFVAGNGGAGGPGLIIIQYQVAQGTSQAGFVG
jgi:hypothetical protein